MSEYNFSFRWINFEEYKEILLNYDLNHNIYQSPDWLNIININKDLNLKFLVAKKNELFFAITPFVNKKKLFFNFFGNPLSGTFCLYKGVLFFDTFEIKDLENFLSNQTKYLENISDYSEYTFNYNNLTKYLNNIFNKLRFKKTENKTLILNLSCGIESIWNNMESRARNSIRKAQKKNIKIKFDLADVNWIDDFYIMLEKTFKKSNRKPPHSKNFYLSLVNLLNKKKILFVSAIKNNEILSKAIFLIDEDKIIYFSGSTNEIGYKYSANSFLLWSIIKDSTIKNYKYFDFGGIGNQSIDKFKKSFGGKEISYVKWIRCNSMISLLIKIIRYLSSKGLININIV